MKPKFTADECIWLKMMGLSQTLDGCGWVYDLTLSPAQMIPMLGKGDLAAEFVKVPDADDLYLFYRVQMIARDMLTAEWISIPVRVAEGQSAEVSDLSRHVFQVYSDSRFKFYGDVEED